MKRIMIPFLLSALGVLAPVHGHDRERDKTDKAVAADEVVDFARATQVFLSERGAEATTPDLDGFEAAVKDHFVWVQLGLFEVRFPLSGLAEHPERLRESAAALVKSELQLLEWVGPLGLEQKALHDDLVAIDRWIKGWKDAALKKVAGKPAPDLAEALAAPEAVRAALDRAKDAMIRGDVLGVPREGGPIRTYLMPTRKDFVEFVAFSGWTRGEQRGNFWMESAVGWAMCFVDDAQIVALEYAVVGAPPSEYAQGSAMNEDDPTRMQQQVVQLAMNSLFDVYCGGRVPPAFVQGLSMNLVIDLYGQIDTRVDGDVHSRETQKREVFIPGGDPDGGMLPKNSAESRWRERKGADHFLKILRLAQKEGRDLAEKTDTEAAVFGVRDDHGSGGQIQAVRAPFLGGAAASSGAIPESFAGDFDELLRAYKSAFIFWLQSEAGGGTKTSKEKFASLLKRLADPAQEGDFETAFSAIYDGAPLSDAQASTASLEGKFLAWLQKQ
jgi:hypothetical protein